MQVKVNRRISVTLSGKEITDGSLSLTLNTDLNAHAYLAGIPTAKLFKLLNNSLDIMQVEIDDLKQEHDGIVE